jgi:hypothetical protein
VLTMDKSISSQHGHFNKKLKPASYYNFYRLK